MVFLEKEPGTKPAGTRTFPLSITLNIKAGENSVSAMAED